MTTPPIERLRTGYYNSLPRSGTNPGGLGANAHKENFPAACADFGAAALTMIEDNAAQRAATEADNDATVVAVTLLKSTTLGAKDDAVAAAVTAVAKAAEAVDARDQAVRRIASDVPDRFDSAGAWFTSSPTGDPAAVSSPNPADVVPIAAFGFGFKATGFASVYSKGVQLALSGRVYEVSVDIEQVSIGAGETPAARIRVQGLDSAYASTGGQVVSPLIATALGVTTISRRFSSAAITNGTIWPQPGVALWLRIGVDINRKSDDSAAAAGSVARVRRMTIRDVTAVYQAEVQAAAAAASAATVTPGTAPFNLVQLDASAKLPALDGSQLLNVDRCKPRVVTAGTTLVASDRGGMVELTGPSSVTFTAAAAATLGDGWYCYICHSGTGDLTFDPNGAELVNGEASRISFPNELILLQCNATQFFARVLRGFYMKLTATRAFPRVTGYARYEGHAVSGGASGAKSGSTATTANGGGGGGRYPFSFPVELWGATQTLTVGAGGAASTTATQNPGGDTIVGALVTVQGAQKSGSNSGGGAAAMGAAFAGAGLAGGTAWGGDSASANSGDSVGPGGKKTEYGAPAGGFFGTNPAVNGPRVNALGHVGGAPVSAGPGLAGTGPGAGGGATQTGAQSGPGNAGEIIIWGLAA